MIGSWMNACMDGFDGNGIEELGGKGGMVLSQIALK